MLCFGFEHGSSATLTELRVHSDTLDRTEATESTMSRKVVTSGRLTGTGKAHTDRTRRCPKPEPAYSLYSTDSEQQVTSHTQY
ncbi:unnamed protein product [Knipowitschia caucasica]|uniref:Uncharacterized protein n=1 Tax=Knipowitschia caucasica TaxID=637954 RepID=A0AAV2LC41_KNICA